MYLIKCNEFVADFGCMLQNTYCRELKPIGVALTSIYIFLFSNFKLNVSMFYDCDYFHIGVTDFYKTSSSSVRTTKCCESLIDLNFLRLK